MVEILLTQVMRATQILSLEVRATVTAAQESCGVMCHALGLGYLLPCLSCMCWENHLGEPT